jgi:hypothetical protein
MPSAVQLPDAKFKSHSLQDATLLVRNTTKKAKRQQVMLIIYLSES